MVGGSENAAGYPRSQTRFHAPARASGKPLGVEPQLALEAVTIDAARQVGQPDRLGSLEAGKEADFTILEDNPFTVDPTKITDIKVSETWVAGNKKFG